MPVSKSDKPDAKHTYRVSPSDEEIDNLIQECSDAENDGRSKFPGMTYEQGVMMALRWVIGEESESPMAD